MEKCDEDPAPAAQVGSSAAGVHPPQARAEVGAGRRSQPHTGPQIPAQQEAARGQRGLVGRVQLCGRPAQAAGRQVARRGFLPARAVEHGQQDGNRQHQPVAGHAPPGPAARLVPFPAYCFQPARALFNPVAAGIQGGFRQRHRGVGQQYPRLRLIVGLQHAPTGPPRMAIRIVIQQLPLQAAQRVARHWPIAGRALTGSKAKRR